MYFDRVGNVYYYKTTNTGNTGWAVLSTGITPAAGNSTEIQFNTAGAFAADPLLTWDGNNLQAAGIIAGNPGLEGSGIIINGAAYDSALKVSDIGGTDIAQVILHKHSSVFSPFLVASRSQGDTNAHVIVNDTDTLFGMIATGWDGGDYAVASEIRTTVAGTPGVNDMPGKLHLRTTPAGSDSPIDRLTIGPDGQLDVFALLVSLGTFTFDTDQAVGAGQDNFVLTYDNGTGLISLEAAPTSPPKLTTAGDLLVFQVSETRKGVGADGTILTADSGSADGLTWAVPTFGNVNNFGAPANNQLVIWRDATTIEGVPQITFDSNGQLFSVTTDMVVANANGLLEIRDSNSTPGSGRPQLRLADGINRFLVKGTSSGRHIELSNPANGEFRIRTDGVNQDITITPGGTGQTVIKNLQAAGVSFVAAASTSAGSGASFAPGIAPSAPNDGDTWVTAGGAFNVQLNGATVDLAGGGGNNLNVVVETTTTRTAVAWEAVMCDDDTAGGAMTITLPAGSTDDQVVVKKLGTTATVTIDGNGTETIDGALTFVLTAQYASITLIWNGTEWSII